MTTMQCHGRKALCCRAVFTPVVLAAMLVSSVPAWGRVEADPNNGYPVTPEAGPWMVMITCYSGEAAHKLAHDLVIELRSRYDLPAYIFNGGEEERKKQQAEIEQQRQQQLDMRKRYGIDPNAPLRVRRVRVEEQFAVLVGGYKDIDTARRELDKIRKLEAPKSVPLDSIGIVGPKLEEGKKGVDYQRTFVNPFKTSFVVPNPTVPVEKPKVNDFAFLKQLNADEKYSLFKCPKPWTLVVKEFFGTTVLVQKESAPKLRDLFGHGQSSLDAGAMQAHEIAMKLRDYMKLEAYVLHTRHGSIVAVGSYDSADDPKLIQNQKLLANLRLGDRIQFLAQPMPMEVPHP